ncbi:hypothetical protein EWM64_g4050 [Hericium alpestre]|uniref:Uncharacterized protein n=1 Tax=Hericium alpestre TaxID=135208 RepID=A0A4Y9ZYR0_9AGAM|nr:hypothetical protein EWM64_g4050 [Hericium alpestre]
MTVWALLGQHSSVVTDVQGCHLATSFITGVHLAVAWEAQAVFDIMMVVLTIVKTLQTRRQPGARMLTENWELVDLIVRDGAIYFVVMAAANLANILTFYPILKGVLSTFAGWYVLPHLLSSHTHQHRAQHLHHNDARLMLNLYEAATPLPTARTNTTLPSMFFTTRIDSSGTAGVFPDGPAPPSSGLGRGSEREEEEIQEIELEEIRRS